ncbi:Core-2/I-Branching enzyme, partial [Oesophagostomum dentatum]
PHSMPKAKYVGETTLDEKAKKPRILFLLQLNGRNERQVKRLLKALYSPSHYYYIHVDQRQLYMLTEVKAVAGKLPNVIVAPDAHSTIWGGASLLTMVQDAIRRSISMPSLSDWDYLINLSESDFPVLSLNELETQLSLDEFPRNLRIDGGSDWIILHREFAEYSISEEELPKKMRTLFGSIILPVESFFHTNAKSKPFYIARKFESLIDIDAIALAEKQALRDRPHLLHTDDVMFNVTFVNYYKADIDGY